MLISYAVMGISFFWSANQTSGYLAGITFLSMLALSWLPLYVYLNRQDIMSHRSYWFSQGAALLITAVVALLIVSFAPDAQSSPGLTALAVSILTYVLFSNFMGVVLNSLFKSVANSVEKKMLPPQTTDSSHPH